MIDRTNLRPRAWGRLVFAAVVAGAAAASMMGAGALSAAASPAPTAPATTGWVRLAHLSPDTSEVDVQLSALAGGSVAKSLKDIGYGDVSDYMALPAGTYVVSMVPAGGDFTKPVIQASVTVAAGEPVTVAAYGRNARLQTAVFRDDLSAPAAGQSRIRVVQASTVVPTVDVATTTGTAIANGAKEGTATDYANVPSGAWTLSLTSGSIASTADVDLQSGAVSTLFVLDNASGGLALKAVLDSTSVGDLPTGGIQTGGGGTATAHVGGAGAVGAGVADAAGDAEGPGASAAADAGATPADADATPADAGVATTPVVTTPVVATTTSSTAPADRARQLVDQATGWVLFAAAVVGVIVVRRRSEAMPSAPTSTTETSGGSASRER